MRRIIPDAVPRRPLSTLSPDDRVIEAVRLMKDRGIGAVLVTRDGDLAGIITERDVVFRVVAAGIDPGSAPIASVMTPNPDTIESGDDVMSALHRMQEGRYRHLPVVEDGSLVGIVSIRDVYACVRAELEEAVLERDAYLAGAWGDAEEGSG